ncbi:MAG: ABC transporter permease [Clostridia bacterium]|nr:ABC transporter permease [Clostridia bacterium]
MNNLIKIEFKKIVKTTYFLASFLIMGILPMVSLMLLLLQPTGFVSGDFNRLNILLMALVMSKTVFPIIAMSLIQIGHGLSGLKSIYLTPINRGKIIMSKVWMAFIWMTILIIFSIAIVVIIELILFRNMKVFGLVLHTLKIYGYIALYSFVFQLVGMVLTLIIGNILVPSLILISYMICEYGLQLQYMISFLPGAIPAYLSGVSGAYPMINTAIFVHVGIGLVALVFLLIKLIHQDYLD